MYQPEAFGRDPALKARLRAVLRGEERPWLRSAKFKISARCNLKCIACSYWKGKEPENLDLANIRQTLTILRDLGCLKVHFSGGEVTLRPDLYDILDHAVGLGMRVNITTNGTLIDRQAAMRLCQCKIKSVAVSIDSADPKVHDGIRGVKGAWKRTMKGLERLLKAREKTRSKLKIRINTLVTRRNCHDLDRMIDLFQGMPLMSLLLIPVDEKNHCHIGLNKARIRDFNDRVAPALADKGLAAGLFKSVDEAYCFGRGAEDLRLASEGQYSRGWFREHLCYVPWLHTFISPNANVYLCCMTRNKIEPLGNLTEQRFDEIWFGKILDNIRRKMLEERFPICHRCDNFLKENRIIEAGLEGKGHSEDEGCPSGEGARQGCS